MSPVVWYFSTVTFSFLGVGKEKADVWHRLRVRFLLIESNRQNRPKTQGLQEQEPMIVTITL